MSEQSTKRVPGASQLEAYARHAEKAGDLDRALGYFRALATAEAERPQWAFEGVRVLGVSGRKAEAAEALKAAMRRWPKALERPELKALVLAADGGAPPSAALARHAPPDEALRRPLVGDDPSRDLIAVRGERDAVVLVFTGLADRMVMPLPLFDRYLAELGLGAIYLRDRRRMGFFSGVSSLGDGYDQAISGLRGLIGDLGAKRVFTLGNSAGGMGAVSYGLDLDAEAILGFSAPIAIWAEMKAHDARAALLADRLLGKVPAERSDFRRRLGAAGRKGFVHLYFGEEMPEDRAHARAFEGIAAVRLHPIEGLAGHGALFRMAESGALRRELAERFA
ncbi:MAG TPA: hypothetical protein VD929_00190 [Caulobacteraceae bacterium]|nr:hypothetical protein [Caulobacteraceae bacterium]